MLMILLPRNKQQMCEKATQRLFVIVHNCHPHQSSSSWTATSREHKVGSKEQEGP